MRVVCSAKTAILGILMTAGYIARDDKQYFIAMIDEVRAKLARLANNSPIRRCYPETRLETIRAKITVSNVEDLERGCWQPPFLFLRNSSDAAILALDDDLRLVESHSVTDGKELFNFLAIESEDMQPWIGRVFELYVKATALRSAEVLNTSLDWKLPNRRRPDLKIELGSRDICIECTSLGESNASDDRWRAHTDMLHVNRDEVFVEGQDAYTQSRRLYAKVFDKIAPQLDVRRSQLNEGGPNLLLISLNAVISDLATSSPAIGWALDELFASQPTGDRSPASLCEWLLRKRDSAKPAASSFDDLLKALAQVSGILAFDGCKFGAARINYNADAVHMISHAEMAAMERLLSVPPLYVNN